MLTALCITKISLHQFATQWALFRYQAPNLHTGMETTHDTSCIDSSLTNDQVNKKYEMC